MFFNLKLKFRRFPFVSILLAASALFLIVSCGTGNSVSVKKFSPVGEVNKFTTFTIEFDKELAPEDTLDKWSDEKYVEFQPAVSGKFKWLTPKKLIFSPDEPLQPMQKYEAKVTDKILFGKKYSIDAEEFSFFTPSFAVDKTEFFWTRIPNSEHKVSIKANVYFNYPVNPDGLQKYIFFYAGGGLIEDFKILTTESSKVIAVDLGEMKQADKEEDIEIKIKKGFSSIIGKKPLENDYEFTYKIPPVSKLAITGISAGIDGTENWIKISTTQTVDGKSLPKFVKIKPDRKLKFSVQENQFLIQGNFSDLPTINLLIKKGLPGMYGGNLEFDFERVVSLVDLEPSINFADKGGTYLLKGGEEKIALNIVNVNEIELEYYKVFKNNIVHFINRNRYSLYDYYDYGYGSSYNVGNFGKFYFKEKKKLNNEKNWLNQIDINLKDKFPAEKYKGIYVITARSNEDWWLRDSKLISLSDIGIIAKKSANDIKVFLNKLSDASPVQGAEVSVISTNNQILGAAESDENGVADFPAFAEDTEDFTPALIFVEFNDDFNYLDLNGALVETSRFDVGGKYDPNGFSAFIYSERNLYRPGDDVNISAIIRDSKINTIRDIPIELKITAPNGKTLKKFTPSLNGEGSFEIKFKLPDYTQTGLYDASLFTGNDKFIGSYQFSVEDFAPDKIRVSIENEKDKFFPGESVTTKINAEYFFGAAASGLKYELETQLREQSFVSGKFSDFDFSDFSPHSESFESAFSDGVLDKEGKAESKFVLPVSVSSGGVIKGVQFLSVFDPTGRTVNRIASFSLYPKKYFIGIKSDGYYHSVNSPIKYEFAVVNEKDEPVSNFSATAELVRFDWNTVLKKSPSGQYRYVSEKKEIAEWRKEVELKNGVGKIGLQVSRSGEYEIRISKKGENGFVRSGFYAWGWKTGTASSFGVDREGKIEIVTDKKKYRAGETAKILFSTPFSGKMLVTFERDSVYDYRYVEVEEGSAELEYTISDYCVPNIFITATLFKPHKGNNMSPFFTAHGFKSAAVEVSDFRLPLKISAAEKVKPNTTQKVKIKTEAKKNIYITLAAVDEGILQVKDYATPDPYGFMYARRGLDVESYDFYKFLLPEIISLNSSSGGDAMAAQLKKRTNPIKSKRYKLVSFWSGIKKTDANGEVEVSFNIPQFNGELRLMAAAYEGKRFGSAERAMKVSEDLIIEPQIPRVLTAGDTLIMPVTIINSTERSGSAKVSVTCGGKLSVLSEKILSVNFSPKKSETVEFIIAASEIPGKSSIEIKTSGFANVKEKTEIAVRPASPFVANYQTGAIAGGQKLTLKLDSEFLEGTQKNRFVVGRFPAIKYTKQLRDLVGYPYGCLEQTVSKLFPQLYFDDLVKLAAPEYLKNRNPVYFIKEGIGKIEAMQRYDGSFSYWRNGKYSNWWASVYAAHFLLEAKKAGYNVSEKVLSQALNYISRKGRSKETYDRKRRTGNKTEIKKFAKKEIIYSLYVEALAGESDLPTMNYYQAHPELLTEDMVYLLAGSYALAGHWNAAFNILPKEYRAATSAGEPETFDSEYRANAIILEALTEIDKENIQIPYIVEYLTKNLNKLYSTQEKAFVFLALGKAAKINAGKDLKIDVSLDGKKIGEMKETAISISSEKLNGKELTLSAEGSGRAFYSLISEGVPLKTGYVEKDNGLAVRRDYFDYKTGNYLEGNKFYQGQLVVGRIALKGENRSAENIVITDIIPAGSEIENPRLSKTARLTFDEKNILYVDYTDIRDDRLILFANVEANKTKYFYYLLRITNKGSFNLSPVSAEAMYLSGFSSVNGGGRVIIK
ncbi:MAG: alpha-2-macroglobulin family protein [Chlorobi bacterium]|nr:alpha-2-macroglobulin family protein [Chlorobiota bacterium]